MPKLQIKIHNITIILSLVSWTCKYCLSNIRYDVSYLYLFSSARYDFSYLYLFSSAI